MLVNVNVAPQTVEEEFFVATVRALGCFASRRASWDSFCAQIAILSVVNSVVDFEALLAWESHDEIDLDIVSSGKSSFSDSDSQA